MSNTILIKRSGTAAAVPVTANLSLGELSLNYADGKLYFLNSSNVVTLLASSNTASGTQLVNGTSNVVVASNSNVTISSAGTANVLLISSTGTVTSGTASVSGNITGGNISATNHTGTTVSITGTVTATSTVGGVITGSTASLSGNVTGGNLITAGLASITGNVNIGNATGVTWANATGARVWTYYNNSATSLDTVFL